MNRLVTGLLVANLVAGLWWTGHLSPLLEPPGAGDREPLRLSRQLRVESLAVLGTPVAASGVTGVVLPARP